MRFQLAIHLTLFAALTSFGCGGSGPSLAPVSGKVLLDGQPLTTGQVLTQPTAGRGANGAIQSDGTFTLSSGREPGAMVGTHQVAVVAYEVGASTSPEAPQGKLLVPQRYTSAENSGLTIEVSSGENTPTLELTSAK
ncbi:hypothetical protein [Lacipirellula sp.]|uniref:hypothetical protein n=1 Tax=Lacipirellula sp. TaxID=2691419 RepID=UPI003D0A614F